MKLATQTLAPSGQSQQGLAPTAMAWTSEPSTSLSSVTVLAKRLATPDVG